MCISFLLQNEFVAVAGVPSWLSGGGLRRIPKMKFQWLLFSLLEAAFLRSDTRKVLTRTVARSDLRMHHSRDILRRTHEAQEAAYNARIHTNGAMVQKGQHAGGTLRTHAGKNGTSEEKYVLTGCYHVDKESLYPELPPYDGEDGALTLETSPAMHAHRSTIFVILPDGTLK